MGWDEHKLPWNYTLTGVFDPFLPLFSWMQATVTLHLSTFFVPWQRKLQLAWQRATLVTEFSACSGLHVYALRNSRNILGNHCNVQLGNSEQFWGEWRKVERKSQAWSHSSMLATWTRCLVFHSIFLALIQRSLRTIWRAIFGPVLQLILKMVRVEIKQWEESGRCLRKEPSFLPLHAPWLPFYHVQTNFTGTEMNLSLGFREYIWL